MGVRWRSEEQQYPRRTDISPVPLTLEGRSLLHQMFASAGRSGTPWLRPASEAVDEAVSALKARSILRRRTGLASLLGHKGDLMLIHFRIVDALNETSCAGQLPARALSGADDFLSLRGGVGALSGSGQLYGRSRRGHHAQHAEWKEQVKPIWPQSAEDHEGRLRPDIPARRYVCFYPMDKKRGEEKNWYAAPFADRQRMMADHGFIGRGYAGRVTQIISGSIGFDDWEWGVDLFADDPVVFKKLVYEMRFDEASALYGLFGPFYMGLQFRAEELGALLEGRTPGFGAEPAA